MPSEAVARAESLIRTIPEHPEPGVLFRDIAPLLTIVVMAVIIGVWPPAGTV